MDERSIKRLIDCQSNRCVFLSNIINNLPFPKGAVYHSSLTDIQRQVLRNNCDDISRMIMFHGALDELLEMFGISDSTTFVSDGDPDNLDAQYKLSFGRFMSVQELYCSHGYYILHGRVDLSQTMTILDDGEVHGAILSLTFHHEKHPHIFYSIVYALLSTQTRSVAVPFATI